MFKVNQIQWGYVESITFDCQHRTHTPFDWESLASFLVTLSWLGDRDWRLRRHKPQWFSVGAGAGKVGRKAKDTRKLYILWQLYCCRLCKAKKSFGTFSRYPLSFSLSFHSYFVSISLSTPSLRSTSFWSNPKKFPIYIVASGICCCSKNWNNQGCCVSVVFNSSWQCFRFNLKYKS